MNFEKIPPVENNKQLIDIAFRRAREHLAQKKLSGDQLTKIKTLETSKIDVIKDVLCSRLTKVSLTFPYIDNLNIFYQKLFAVTIDIPAFKKSVASLTWATTKIKQFQKIYNSKSTVSLAVISNFLHALSKAPLSPIKIHLCFALVTAVYINFVLCIM